MNILSIVPARSNSKGIPGKNIIPIQGKPLIAWNILAAKKSKYINRIVVSTDGIEIKNVSLQYGAEVITRPNYLSNDTATSESALIHVLNTLKEKENYQPDLVVFMQCTSPLTNSEDIDNCIQKLIDEKADSATTVTPFHYFIWEEQNHCGIGINHDKNIRLRRQDRKPQYIETGAVYVMKTNGFLESKHRFFGKTVLSVMPPERVKEIDEPNDLVIAEIMLKKEIQKEQNLSLPHSIDTVFFDFDGVMTDDTVIIDENGKESIPCSRADGMGVSLLKKIGINIVVLSTEKNPVVSARCKKLDIECYQNLGFNKKELMVSYLKERNIFVENTVYMGNDINDIECMRIAGCAVAPHNAISEVKNIAHIITQKSGGNGAVRELCDIILNKINNE